MFKYYFYKLNIAVFLKTYLNNFTFDIILKKYAFLLDINTLLFYYSFTICTKLTVSVKNILCVSLKYLLKFEVILETEAAGASAKNLFIFLLKFWPSCATAEKRTTLPWE